VGPTYQAPRATSGPRRCRVAATSRASCARLKVLSPRATRLARAFLAPPDRAPRLPCCRRRRQRRLAHTGRLPTTSRRARSPCPRCPSPDRAAVAPTARLLTDRAAVPTGASPVDAAPPPAVPAPVSRCSSAASRAPVSCCRRRAEQRRRAPRRCAGRGQAGPRPHVAVGRARVSAQ
jgi:hypothetical protein